VTEHLKQSISALLDDEASEIEVHRLLREFGDDGDLKLSWIRYQQIRAVSQGYHHLSETQHISLHESISAAIHEEQYHEVTPVQRPGWQRQASGFAVAASLVAAVLVGVNLNQPNSASMTGLADTKTPRVIDAQTVSTSVADQGFGPVSDTAFSEDELELHELDEVKQQQLREYLMRHDRMSRLNNNARTVNYQPKSGN
jgi:sigma-E factor negative regulatory protein RseA